MQTVSTIYKKSEIRTLARFRSEIRRFLQFSEKAAAAAGLEPQQHQLLLQIAGVPDGVVVTISYIAEVMGLRHHTVVELSKRCELAGHVHRTIDPNDRRCVLLELTTQGESALHHLSEVHAQQLGELAPSLIKALTEISGTRKHSVNRSNNGTRS